MVLKCICYNMFLLCIRPCYIVYEHVTKQLENHNINISNKSNTLKCYRCNQYGHFIKDCPNIITITKQRYNKPKSRILCTRCGRNSHITDKCYANTDIKGNILLKRN